MLQLWRQLWKVLQRNVRFWEVFVLLLRFFDWLLDTLEADFLLDRWLSGLTNCFLRFFHFDAFFLLLLFVLLSSPVEGSLESLLVPAHLGLVVIDAGFEVLQDAIKRAEVVLHLEVVAAALVGPPAADEPTHRLEHFPQSALLVVAHLVGVVVDEEDIPDLLLLAPVPCLGPVAGVPLNQS